MEKDEAVKAALKAREEAFVDLWLAVMKHYDEVPAPVKAAWDVANRATNAAMQTLKELL